MSGSSLLEVDLDVSTNLDVRFLKIALREEALALELISDQQALHVIRSVTGKLLPEAACLVWRCRPDENERSKRPRAGGPEVLYEEDLLRTYFSPVSI